MKDNFEQKLESLKKENLMLREHLLSLYHNGTSHLPIDKLRIAENEKDSIYHISEWQFLLAEPFFSPFMDLSPNHLVMINSEGIITFMNAQTAKDFHVDPKDMIGRHIRELLKIPDDQIMLLKTLHTGRPIKRKEVLDRNYGINSTSIFRNEKGDIFRVLGYFQFLNSFRDAEKDALSGRIAAGIAHEIRNPLTTVKGFLQILKDQIQPEYAAILETLLLPEIDRANKIISDFLAVAKPAETATELLPVSGFLINFIGNFLNSEAHLHNALIHYHIEKEAEDCIIKGNKEELLQVFINLMRNSIQARKDIPLEINLSVKRENHKISFSFSDNGRGIPNEMLPHIFDPFFTTKDEGTGLGLSLSRKIIENHKGSMKVKSSTNGTVFTLVFPIYSE
ncbi:two-component system sensor histidine kinase NtrB [Metabacillus sp. RGM 3146]|uniref:two-component system sensor histidine kinase NtrB n=1 Tax=Metabacillus sp. RGM 3146 TaxID=3401092 RepID=UPI003B9ADD98